LLIILRRNNVPTSDLDQCAWMTDEVQDIDLRNPSRYFMVFETGDNTTVEVGEAEPLDLFYGRAERFGDDYVVWTETDTDSADATVCYPSDPHDVLDVSDVIIDSGFCNEFDNMNTGGDTHPSEACFFYGLLIKAVKHGGLGRVSVAAHAYLRYRLGR